MSFVGAGSLLLKRLEKDGSAKCDILLKTKRTGLLTESVFSFAAILKNASFGEPLLLPPHHNNIIIVIIPCL